MWKLNRAATLWIILDANRLVQSGKDENSSLETSIILAASVAAEFLGGGERRSVGLLTAPSPVPPPRSSEVPTAGDRENPAPVDPVDGALGNSLPREQEAAANLSRAPLVLVDVPPQPGKGQVWRILAALAPVNAGELPLAELLRRQPQCIQCRSNGLGYHFRHR